MTAWVGAAVNTAAASVTVAAATTSRGNAIQQTLALSGCPVLRFRTVTGLYGPMRTLTTTITALGLCVLTAGCDGGKPGPLPPEVSASASSTSTAATPVAESALDGLLLSPADIGAAVGSTGMYIVASNNALAQDIQIPSDAPKEKLACVGVAGTAEALAYAGSGSTAARDQFLQGPGTGGAQLAADQSVVLFPSAEAAAAFFAASAEKWPACHEFTLAGATSPVGPSVTNNGMLSTSFTRENKTCQRALTVANNVGYPNVLCVEGDGVHLPFSDCSFDVVITRLAEYATQEAFRVLRQGGYFLEYGLGPDADQEIKEFFADRIEKENFFFPQELGEWKLEVCKPVLDAGFEVNSIDEYKEKDLYTDTATLMDIIEMVPLVTDFDRKKDRSTIEELADKYKVEGGFSTTWHYYIIVAQKP